MLFWISSVCPPSLIYPFIRLSIDSLTLESLARNVSFTFTMRPYPLEYWRVRIFHWLSLKWDFFAIFSSLKIWTRVIITHSQWEACSTYLRWLRCCQIYKVFVLNSQKLLLKVRSIPLESLIVSLCSRNLKWWYHRRVQTTLSKCLLHQ